MARKSWCFAQIPLMSRASAGACLLGLLEREDAAIDPTRVSSVAGRLQPVEQLRCKSYIAILM
jgi:hypothetical protein